MSLCTFPKPICGCSAGEQPCAAPGAGREPGSLPKGTSCPCRWGRGAHSPGTHLPVCAPRVLRHLLPRAALRAAPGRSALRSQTCCPQRRHRTASGFPPPSLPPLGRAPELRGRGEGAPRPPRGSRRSPSSSRAAPLRAQPRRRPRAPSPPPVTSAPSAAPVGWARAGPVQTEPGQRRGGGRGRAPACARLAPPASRPPEGLGARFPAARLPRSHGDRRGRGRGPGARARGARAGTPEPRA